MRVEKDEFEKFVKGNKKVRHEGSTWNTVTYLDEEGHAVAHSDEKDGATTYTITCEQYCLAELGGKAKPEGPRPLDTLNGEVDEKEFQALVSGCRFEEQRYRSRVQRTYFKPESDASCRHNLSHFVAVSVEVVGYYGVEIRYFKNKGHA